MLLLRKSITSVSDVLQNLQTNPENLRLCEYGAFAKCNSCTDTSFMQLTCWSISWNWNTSLETCLSIYLLWRMYLLTIKWYYNNYYDFFWFLFIIFHLDRELRNRSGC